MEPASTSALVSGIATAAAAGANAISSNVKSKKAYRHAKWLQEQQQEYNLNSWNLANEYNLPANQVARLRAAGLNPYAFLDGSANGNAGSFQPVGLPNVQEYPNDFSFVSELGDRIGTFRSSINNNVKSEIDNKFEEALKDLNTQLEKHKVSLSQYNADIAMMQRNKAVFTFSDDLLTTFLNRDWTNRKLKNDLAIEIQRGSALEDVLGLKMTENRGWQDDQNPTDFGFGAWHEGRVDPDSVHRKAENNYYNFLYRGSRDKNNPIYQSFLQDFKNLETRAILQSIEPSMAKSYVKNVNLSDVIDSTNRLAESSFEQSLRNGFSKIDGNMLLYHGIRAIESVIKSVAPSLMKSRTSTVHHKYHLDHTGSWDISNY